MARTPKSQSPNPKSQTNPKLQIPKDLHLFHAFWNLGFGASLELGIWNLGFFSSEIFAHVVSEVVNRRAQRHRYGTAESTDRRQLNGATHLGDKRQ
jgi:hypothetical protein